MEVEGGISINTQHWPNSALTEESGDKVMLLQSLLLEYIVQDQADILLKWLLVKFSKSNNRLMI